MSETKNGNSATEIEAEIAFLKILKNKASDEDNEIEEERIKKLIKEAKTKLKEAKTKDAGSDNTEAIKQLEDEIASLKVKKNEASDKDDEPEEERIQALIAKAKAELKALLNQNVGTADNTEEIRQLKDEIASLKVKKNKASDEDNEEEEERIKALITKAKAKLEALNQNNPKAPEEPPKITNPEDGKLFDPMYAYKVDADGERKKPGEKFDMQRDFFNLTTLIPNAPSTLTLNRSPQITPAMLLALKSKDYTHVSRTQFHALPHILEHYDPSKSPAEQTPGNHCVIQGPAGTGKTMAFIVGSVAQIDANIKKPQVLIINHAVDLAEQNKQQCDLLCWESKAASGGNVLYDYHCACTKGIPNEAHTCERIQRSRLGKEVEIESGKLVGKMEPDWKKVIAVSTYSAQFVSMSKGVLEELLKKRNGHWTPRAIEFLKEVRVVVIDEAE